ncbi:MAG: Uncharacterized protein CEN87_582, partial [Parcubacteria group bacterium Licking1014_1]
RGMHCASCEILIEKKILELDGVKSVESAANKGQVVIEYEKETPTPQKLNKMFREENYTFFEKSSEELKTVKSQNKTSATLVAFNIAIFIIVAFLFLNKLGLSGILNVGSKSSLFAFFGLGLLAGISSCAALVGGMVLSISKQWQSIYSDKNTTYEKLQPHLLFNAGRLISYAFFGAILGIVGSRLQISFQFTSFLVIAVSFLMLALGLQMLGVKTFRKLQFTLPKSATRYIADENNFQGKYMPSLMGAATFFLPCGFTITAQGLALLSGSWLQGSLIMFFFALGTVPMLLFIGLSSVKFSSKPHLAERFSKVAGFLVLFFALFNINSQMNVLGFTGFSNIIGQNQRQNIVSEKDLPLIVDGKQIVKMNASSSGYNPNYIKVRAGVPVRWEVTDIGTSGCTNAIISRSLFDGSIDLTPGQVSVKEFTPTKPGKYKFSCWMGMVTGIIEVVPQSGSAAATAVANNSVSAAVADSADGVIPSGAKGCGCGGGNSCGAR